MADLSPRGIGQFAAAVGAAAQNALEVARFGGLDTGEEASPFEVVHETPMFRLRRYFPDSDPEGRPPIVLVPPMMLAADVYDVAPATSAVALLHDHGVDPFVVDFGSPDEEEGGLERTLTDHVVAVSEVVEKVNEITGRDVHLSGYSQGGMFCYQSASFRRAKGIASVITYGSPVDTRSAIPLGLPEDVVARGMGVLADTVLPRITLPAWASRTGFRLLDPMKSLRSRVDFLMQLHDRDALLPRERQRRFLEAEGWVAWSGPAIAELMRQFVVHNRMVSGGFVIQDRLVTLADLECPILCFVGTVDEIAPTPAVRAILRAAPRADIHEVSLRAGHFGLVVGGSATRTTWPVVAEWMQWREGEGDKPEPVVPMVEELSNGDDPGAPARAGHAVGLVTGTSLDVARSSATAAWRGSRAVGELVASALDQLPRLNRLAGAGPDTRVSMGLLLEEQSRRNADGTFFLWEDRAHTYGDANRRIDNVVRGLISVGVRQGEHVGVLMGTRPSAVAVTAALNRLGAVVVLLRPDGDVAREAELADVHRVIADPERVDLAKETGAEVLVLGGGGEPRDLGSWLIDMERIDPDAVPLPAWYQPNPGRSRDLAFILFTGRNEKTRMNRITNRRWAVSAFGTASAAALDARDTVYCLTPVHHPSGLLTAVGGAVAGGSRLAMATAFDASTFWDEVRRYGVTVVSYTWTLTRELVEAARNPAERHHPVRLFVGSGMPSGLWRRTVERFGANVLEFYASTEGEAVLVNLTGHKIGAKGRRLPGSARVRLAAVDMDAGKMLVGDDGLAIRPAVGEPGMLLAEADLEQGGLLGAPLRGMFEKGDAWHSTGDLFRQDEDGDFWLIDHIDGLVRTAAGVIPTLPIEDGLFRVPGVDLASAYGIPAKGGAEVAAAAITVRRGTEVDARAVTHALASLEERERPQVVRIVERIPVSTWFRPLKRALREEGVPEGSTGFVWNAKAQEYKALTEAARKRLKLAAA